MSKPTLADAAKQMREIDFAMLFTRSDDGELAGRPMSNNREVEYQGDCYFFADENTRAVRDIHRDAKVGLAYQGSAGLLAKPVFIAMEAHASVVKDTGAFQQHWSKDLERWFDKGIDTPGLVMIKVSAKRIHYWHGSDETEIEVR